MRLTAPHNQIPAHSQAISQHIWKAKYRQPNEDSPADSHKRVVQGTYSKDNTDAKQALEAINKGLLIPAGRILAGAGTSNRVTLINCYVMETIPDSLRGIMNTLCNSAYTMQQGGGIGMDFSPLRPRGAALRRAGAGAVASGPKTYMDTWDAMCGTIMSAGTRRGAMMAVLSISHPDILEFISCKQQPGKLTNFNISVLVSDDFMTALAADADWELKFDGTVYRSIPARELWSSIIKNTYEYSEPGVIFIDRVNKLNNLRYCETISCTNPCGEQPLPPNGACCLAAINLARLVERPFTADAKIDRRTLAQITRIGIRLLDNVLDVTNYPIKAQAEESYNKRRIGFGVTGLANMLAMLQLSYGSPESIAVISSVLSLIKETAYDTSVNLAKERGAFPAFKKEKYLARPFIQSLSPSLKVKIKRFGIRNGVLLTIAPTGTTSLYFNNPSSGIEPSFGHNVVRKVLNDNGEFDSHAVIDYGVLVYKAVHGEQADLPSYMLEAADLSVDAHLRVQAAAQEHIDSSISKTINCPKDMSYSDFEQVYTKAYELGCKGCTTYRPSDVRGSILTIDGEDASAIPIVHTELPKRPAELSGRTYKIDWPAADAAFYITINNDKQGHPFELFISSKAARYQEWTTALSLMITAIFRRGGDVSFVAEGLKKVISANENAWIDGQQYGSLVALIGKKIEDHIGSSYENPASPDSAAEHCPKCNSTSLSHAEGCITCYSCGWSECG